MPVNSGIYSSSKQYLLNPFTLPLNCSLTLEGNIISITNWIAIGVRVFGIFLLINSIENAVGLTVILTSDNVHEDFLK